MYQEKCFSWPSGEILDLNTLLWVENWSPDTQILINDTQFENKPICRNFDYFVDSSSNSTIELGTKKFPYKSLGLVFVELANYHSHSNRTINIFMKESTINEILVSKNYIINTTQIKFRSYSSSSSSIPQKTTLMMRDKNVTLFSSLTLFNIMKNSDLRLDAAISQNNLMTSTEKKMLASTDTWIMISRSSVLFDSIIFKSNLSDISLSIFYIRPIYLQTKTLTITNVDFIVRISFNLIL